MRGNLMALDWRLFLVVALVIAMAWSLSTVYFAYQDQIVKFYNPHASQGQVSALVYNPHPPGPATGLVSANVATG